MPQEALSLRLSSQFREEDINGSSDIRQPAETAGKTPRRCSFENLADQSMRTEAWKR